MVARSDSVVTHALAALGEGNVRVAPLLGSSHSGGGETFPSGGGGSGGGFPDGVGGSGAGGQPGYYGSDRGGHTTSVSAASAAHLHNGGHQDPEGLMLDQVRAKLESVLAHTKAAMATPAPGASSFGGGGGYGGGAVAPSAQQQQHTQHLAAQVHLLEAALDAVVTHSRLALLLRAELPHSLLPAVPPGYMARRIVELAEGTCVANFIHDGGRDLTPRLKLHTPYSTLYHTSRIPSP